MSDDDLRAELERLRKENESLKKGAAKGISMKVSEKGGLSIYGLGRFPITLYKEQWTKLLDMSDEIRSFLVDTRRRAQNEVAFRARRRFGSSADVSLRSCRSRAGPTRRDRGSPSSRPGIPSSPRTSATSR